MCSCHELCGIEIGGGVYCAVLVEGVTDVLPECGHFGLGDGVEGGAECGDALFERCACGGQVGAHPCLDGAVVPQDKDSTVRVILLGREGGCVNGYVRVPIREELV